MKRTNLFLIAAIISVSCICAQNKQLIGTYSFRHSTNDYEEDYEMVQEVDSNGDISIRRGKPYPDDGCCTQTAALELKPDFTFYMSYHNDQGDYDMTFEFVGIYVVNNDTLTMYSPILATVNENIPENLFELSLRDNFWNMEQFSFYSMDKDYRKEEIMPLYTIPDKNVDFDFDATIDTTLSFVFKREDIGNYFYCFEKPYDKEQCGIPIFNRSLLLKMSDKKYNYFQDFDSNFRFFWRINEFSFIIGDSLLKSIYQTSDETGRKYYYEFIKKEDKRIEAINKNE
ncbi:MAG: hypothetical protein FWF52_02560 [Candidatus Azobacteroides sp.]|nr:hypothetical protein [Candidatus Azobacteroides sp.]